MVAVLGLLEYVRKQVIEGGKANAFAGMGIFYGGGPAGWSMSIDTALPEPQQIRTVFRWFLGHHFLILSCGWQSSTLIWEYLNFDVDRSYAVVIARPPAGAFWARCEKSTARFLPRGPLGAE